MTQGEDLDVLIRSPIGSNRSAAKAFVTAGQAQAKEHDRSSCRAGSSSGAIGDVLLSRGNS
ncbi:hypothetical protein [Nonomuraea sp. JJY05]|uniref:hypothetical protein n=1 Tax=Nonomuraea sp. JJY05 TaxID=3350255 RepID=UPI00373FA772